MSGVARFDCYPSDFLNGLVGLKSDQIAAYTVLIMLQYDRGEAVQYVGRERELSVRAGLPRGRLAVAIDDLLTLGKIHKTDAGWLYDNRTVKELEKISERISKNTENSLTGGEATKKKWEQIRNQNNCDEGPNGQPTGKPKQGPNSPPSPPPPPSPDQGDNDFLSLSDAVGGIQEKEKIFESFWEKFPKGKFASKPKARILFMSLPLQDCHDAIACLGAFSAHVRAKPPTDHPMNPDTFIRDRIWENFAAGAKGADLLEQVERMTPEGEAWEAYRRHTTGRGVPWSNGHWMFPTRWPPGSRPPTPSPTHEQPVAAQ